MRRFVPRLQGPAFPSVLSAAALGLCVLAVFSFSGCAQQPALSHEAGSFLPEAGSAVGEAGSAFGEAGSELAPADPFDEFNFNDAPDFFDVPKKRESEVSKKRETAQPKRSLDEPDPPAIDDKPDDDRPVDPQSDDPDGFAAVNALNKLDEAKLQPPGPESWASFRNGNAQLGVATTKLPEKLELKWKFPAEDGVPAPAAIVGDHVYVGLLKGDLVCLELKTGKPVWSYRSIDDPDPDTFAPGFKAGCRVTEDTVYIGDEDGVFHAVDRATGKKKWRFQTQGEIAGCAAIVGDHVIIGSHDSFLYCFNAVDGTVVWKFQTQDRVNCSPAVVGDFTFVAGCDEHLRVINVKTGKEKSDIPLNTYLIASPAVLGDMLYVGTYASEVVALNWQDEAVVWRYKDDDRDFPYHASAAVTDKYVVVGGHDKVMHCIDRETGKKVWTFPTRGRIDSSPVIVDERVFFGSSDGNLYELGLKDGKERWKFTTKEDITAAPAVGEGHLVVGSEGGKGFVYCFGAK